MKQVVNGKMYNTETAEELFNVSNSLGVNDFRNYDFCVYRTRKGNYFLSGEGGPMTMFARPCGNMTGGGSAIIPISKDEALEWAENNNSNANADDIEKIFEVEEA